MSLKKFIESDYNPYGDNLSIKQVKFVHHEMKACFERLREEAYCTSCNKPYIKDMKCTEWRESKGKGHTYVNHLSDVEKELK